MASLQRNPQQPPAPAASGFVPPPANAPVAPAGAAAPGVPAPVATPAPAPAPAPAQQGLMTPPGGETQPKSKSKLYKPGTAGYQGAQQQAANRAFKGPEGFVDPKNTLIALQQMGDITPDNQEAYKAWLAEADKQLQTLDPNDPIAKDILRLKQGAESRIQLSERRTEMERLSQGAEQYANIDPSTLGPEQAGQYKQDIQNRINAILQIAPNAMDDPEHPQYAALQQLQQGLQRFSQYEDVKSKQDTLSTLLARANGEGVEDLASVTQLATGFDRAEAQLSSALGGARGARSQALMQARQAAMQQQETRQRDMVMNMERLAAWQAATQLSGDIQNDITQAGFASADMEAAMAQAKNSLKQAGLDAQAMIQETELLARAREQATAKASHDAWVDTLAAGGLTAAGITVGAMVGGPAGAAVGGSLGGAAGQMAGGWF